MVLWTTPDKFYISSEESPSRLMLIDRVTGQATGYSLSDQHILSPINPKHNDWFSKIFKDLHRLFWNSNTQVLQVLNFRTICVNLRKSDNISRHVLG